MTTASEAKIYERLNLMARDIGTIKTKIAVVASACEDCRPQVMGNGNDSMATRLDRLEQVRTGRSTAFWLGVASLCSLIVSVVSGIAVGTVLLAIGK